MIIPSAEQVIGTVAAPIAALAIIGLTGVRLLVFIPLSVSLLAVFLIFGMRRAAARRRAAELAGLHLIIQETLSRMAHGKPFPAALRASIGHARPDDAARSVLGIALARMEAGDMPKQAIGNAIADQRCSGFSDALKEGIACMARAAASANMAGALRSFDEELERNATEASERRAGRMQRSGAISMLLGTIVPSFMTFGLVGYSIVYQQGLLLGAFAVMLVVAMPGLYSMSTGWMDES
ncbi:MAG: hypothetical protein M1158_04360 [Candidatus Marsarchaeota archaeon]|jgi:hypothetical protein|nr:hypothetical protein [Candidatus Marsarchaeota archaeon]